MIRSGVLDSLIQNIVTTYRKSKIQSEAEVRSKLIVPLLEVMGYAAEYRSEEFPVYGYDGRKKLAAKSADFILFDSIDFAEHRTRTQKCLKWVRNHSILVVEAKKPGEMPEELGQAQFYTMWTKAPAYILTDGEDIFAYFYNPIAEDYEILKDKIDNIGKCNLIQKLSFKTLLTLKKEGIKAFQNLEGERFTHTAFHTEMTVEELNIPPEVVAYYRGLLGKNAISFTDMQVLSSFLNMTNVFLQNDIRYDIPQYMVSIPRHFYDGKLYVDNSIFPILSGTVVDYYWNNITRYEFDSQYIQAVIVYIDDKLADFEVGFQVLDSKVAERINNFMLVQKCLNAQTLRVVVNNESGLNLVLNTGNPGDMWKRKEYMLQIHEFWLSGLNKLRAIEEYYSIEFHLRYIDNSEEVEEMLESIDMVYNGIFVQENCEISLPRSLFTEDWTIKEPMLFQEDVYIPLPERIIHGIVFQAYRTVILPCSALSSEKNESDVILLPCSCEYQIVEAVG